MNVIKKQLAELNTESPQVNNNEPQDFMTPFTGSYAPSVDPALIGPNNYKSLINMRYKKDGSGIEGVNGYYDFNANAIANSFTTITTGIHYLSNREDDSFVVVHAANANSIGKLMYSTNAIGVGEGNGVIGTNLYLDTTAQTNPRLAKGPAGSLAYCNDNITALWFGDQASLASMFSLRASSNATDIGYLVDEATNGWAFPVDYTDLMNSDSTSDAITLTTANRPTALILSTRLLAGIKFYVSGANTNGANTTLKGFYWDGSKFDEMTLTDGTSKYTQTGTITFTPATTPRLYHYEGRYLYAYLITMNSSSGTSAATIYQIATVAPMQSIKNVWDGVYRQPIQVQRYTAANVFFEDYTLHVQESSTVGTPVGLYMGAMTANDLVYMMFEEPMAAVNVTMLGSLVNANNAILNVLQYWDGANWANTTSLTDRTRVGNKSFASSGLISWEPPADGLEQKITLFGTTGYMYKLQMNATISGSNKADVVADIITAVPARLDIEKYAFPAQYKNKLMLCGYRQGNEGNRIDFSADNAPEVFNGEDSSMAGFQSIYVGSTEDITAATQLYNRFGSNIFSTFVILKNNEVWLLTGDSPLDYQLFPVSFRIGCPAPYSLCTAEVGFELGESVERNVAMWVSHQGPMMFDGAVLHPLEGVDNYFDPNNEVSVNWDYLHKSQSWFDSTYQEWNILIPTGVSTTLNTWLIYNVKLKKWFTKDVGDAEPIVCGIPCIATSGQQIVYGGANDGRLYHLETGASWNGNEMYYEVHTGDFFPSGNQWDITLLRRIKLLVKRILEDGAVVDVATYINTNDDIIDFIFTDTEADMTYSGDPGYAFWDLDHGDDTYSEYNGYIWVDGAEERYRIDIYTPTDFNRLINKNVNTNQTGWAHSIKFSFHSDETAKGFDPIMWGYEYQVIRKDAY